MCDLRSQAEAGVRSFVSAHPGYTVAPDQPGYRGGTNWITLGYHHRHEVVFKWFCQASRWANELFCLRHFAATGLVPKVLEAVPDRLIVMERIAGSDLLAVVQGDSPDRALTRRLSHSLGRALVRWCDTPLPAPSDPGSPVEHFQVIAWGRTMSAVLGHYVRLCRGIQRTLPAYREPPFDASLRLLESQMSGIERERRVLFHEDLSNARAEGEHILAFYDLEMCRLGTVSMQLGVALNLCGRAGLDWASLRRGFEAEARRALASDELASVLAMSHFYGWIRVCRWGQWDGDPAQAHHLEASDREAELWKEKMRRAGETIGLEL